MTRATTGATTDAMVPLPPSGPHGDEPVTCTARAKATGLRCQRMPIRGASVCYVHGGAAGQVRAAARRRLEAERVEAEVKNAIAFESRQGVSNPLQRLAELADESLAMKEALAARVNGLNALRYKAAGAGTEQLRAEVALYERALDRTARFLDLLAKSGFEERRTRLAEEEGQMVAQVIRAILGRLSLSVEQQALVATVVPEELRRLIAIQGQVLR